MTTGWSRRRFLAGTGVAAGAVVAGGVLSGCGGDARHSVPAARLPHVELPSALAGLPQRQHAWEAFESRDSDGNATAPRLDRLLFFDVVGTPTPAHARILEAGLRHIEHSYAWSHAGVLFSASWGHHYFADQLKVVPPVPQASAMSDFESPAIDAYDLCLHLASDHEAHLDAVEAELRDGPHAITAALAWRETRTGFTGAGLPAAHQDVQGVPAGHPVSTQAPLYMGFKSGLKGNQASEDAVTIPSGPFRDGTTMAVSYMTLSLDSWYGQLSRTQQVGLMYSPETTLADQAAITTDAESDPGDYNRAITRYGVVGHSQTCARARRGGKAIILRRDFDTADGGQAGLHFVCLQRDYADFIRTRTAMNAVGAQLQNPSVTENSNNGINAFIFVLKRGSYMMPCRSDRAFPLLPDRLSALT